MASDVVTFLATFLSWSEASLLFALIVCRPLLALVNIWIYNNNNIIVLVDKLKGSGIYYILYKWKWFAS